jgi:hypothetical protein
MQYVCELKISRAYPSTKDGALHLCLAEEHDVDALSVSEAFMYVEKK